MGKCASRFAEVTDVQKRQWRAEVLDVDVDDKEPQMLAQFAQLCDWKEKYESQYQQPSKSRMPNFMRRKIRAKMHDMAHDQIVCLVLEVLSNLCAQLEAALAEAEAEAPTPAPISVAKITNAMNGAVLSFRFRRYGPAQFEYLRELAVSQISWQLSAVHGDPVKGVAEAHALVEQAVLPVLRRKVEELAEMVDKAPAIAQLEQSSGMGAALTGFLQQQLKANSEAVIQGLQKHLMAVLDLSTLLEQMSEPNEGEPYTREDVAMMIAEKIDQSISDTYDALDDEVAGQLNEVADYMDGTSTALAQATTPRSIAVREASVAAGAEAPYSREGRRRKSLLIKTISRSMSPGVQSADDEEAPGTPTQRAMNMLRTSLGDPSIAVTPETEAIQAHVELLRQSFSSGSPGEAVDLSSAMSKQMELLQTQVPQSEREVGSPVDALQRGLKDLQGSDQFQSAAALAGQHGNAVLLEQLAKQMDGLREEHLRGEGERAKLSAELAQEKELNAKLRHQLGLQGEVSLGEITVEVGAEATKDARLEVIAEAAAAADVESVAVKVDAGATTEAPTEETAEAASGVDEDSATGPMKLP